MLSILSSPLNPRDAPPAVRGEINDSASLLEKAATCPRGVHGFVGRDSNPRLSFVESKGCRGAANEICALGIQYRGCLWSDLCSSVVLYGAGNRWAGSTSDYASDVLLRIRRGDACVATPV